MANKRLHPMNIQIEQGSSKGLTEVDDEPLSPTARMLQAPKLNVCIIAVMGSKTTFDVDVVKRGLENTLIKHPRFSSLSVMKGRDVFDKKVWKRTKVNIDNHVIIPQIDLNMDSSSSDKFVDEYITNLSTTLMDFTKPLWEMHILNIKTSDANAVIVFRVHHSIGDGVSLMNLLLACTRKSSDPQALPTLPQFKQLSTSNSTSAIWRLLTTIWTVILMLLNTFVDLLLITATTIFLKDTNTPIKGAAGVELTPKRIVHQTVSLADIKLVKTAVDSTVNDVLVGVTEAGLSRYLNGRYAAESKQDEKEHGVSYLPKSIRLRATLMVNIRPSAGIEDLAEMMRNEGSAIKLGTKVGHILLPFEVTLHENPLSYIRNAKASIDRKKLSFESICAFYSGQYLLKLFGVKQAVSTLHGIVSSTTLSFSSVVGPQEEISLFGHPLAYIAPSLYGLPQALVIHWQSYGEKMILSLSVDPNVIPDPYKLAYDIQSSLKLIKNAVIDMKS